MESLTLVDSNLIIDSSNDDPNAKEELTRIGSSNIIMSAVTEWEILRGALNKTELKKFSKYLKRFNILQLDKLTSQQAGILLKTYHLSHGLDIPDALIAATAIRHKLKLRTNNKKDFIFIKGLVMSEE